MSGEAASLRSRVYHELDLHPGVHGPLSRTNLVLVVLILTASVIGVLETEPLLTKQFGHAFTVTEYLIGLIFAAEYGVRVWTAPERDPSRSATHMRLRFIFSLAGLMDLIVVAASFVPEQSTFMLLRWVRLIRVLRLARLGRFTHAFDYLIDAIRSRKEELGASVLIGFLLMIVSATCLHVVEGGVQPDKFGSIPRALWWSVATLTTIGYGDVFPITPLGKFLAAITALFSIGLIAMPTGILAAAFSDAITRHHQAEIERTKTIRRRTRHRAVHPASGFAKRGRKRRSKAASQR